MEPAVRTDQVTVNGIDFTYLESGTGPLALCLHGFPDSANTWRHLLGDLAAAGFRTVAPFQRGYAPTGLDEDGFYQTGALAKDALALHDAFGGGEDAVIIGHDWGALATYGAAVTEPDRFARVVAMAVPPGGAMGAALLGNLDQVKRSWYMFLFQHPLAELITAADDLALIDRLWSDWSPGFEAATEVELVKPSLRRPDNLRAALGYYRAALGAGPIDATLDNLQASTSEYPPQPMLYLHGANDGCVGREVADASAQAAPANISFQVLEGVGHFLHLERPTDVNRLIVEFLTS